MHITNVLELQPFNAQAMLVIADPEGAKECLGGWCVKKKYRRGLSTDGGGCVMQNLSGKLWDMEKCPYKWIILICTSKDYEGRISDATVAHEAFHLVNFVFRYYDTPYKKSTEELYAYTIANLLFQITSFHSESYPVYYISRLCNLLLKLDVERLEKAVQIIRELGKTGGDPEKIKEVKSLVYIQELYIEKLKEDEQKKADGESAIISEIDGLIGTY